MTARIIDGAALSQRIREEVAQRVAALAAKGTRPGLAVVLVGEDPASQVYVRNKVAACEKAGLHSVKEQYPADMTEAELLARIDKLNRDPSIHGILVQLPLPKHIDVYKRQGLRLAVGALDRQVVGIGEFAHAGHHGHLARLGHAGQAAGQRCV